MGISNFSGNLLTKALSIIINKTPAEIEIFLSSEDIKGSKAFGMSRLTKSHVEEACGVEGYNIILMLIDREKYKKEKKKFRTLTNDNQLDAIRHFMFSALLASQYGYGASRALMVAHEQHRDVSAREKMDLYNNELGLKFGATYYETGKSPKELIDNISQKAFWYLHTGGLSVLKRDRRLNKKCQAPQFYPNNVHESINLTNFFLLKDGLPSSCKKNKSSICNSRKTSKSKAFCLYRREPKVSKICRKELKYFFTFKAKAENSGDKNFSSSKSSESN